MFTRPVIQALIATISLVILASGTAYSQGIRITIPPTVQTIHADLVGEFHEDLCAFSVASLWGFFDTDGKVVIPPVLDHVAGRGYPSFHSGLCLVRTPGTTSSNPRVRFVGRRGSTVPILSPAVIDATQFSNGLAFVLEADPATTASAAGTYHIYAIDTLGKERPGSRQTLREHLGRPTLLQPLFHHGLSVAMDYQTHLHGYIDTTGVFVIAPGYSDAGIFSEGLGAVLSAVSSGDLRWGFVDRKGRMVVEPRYEHQPGAFSSGRSGYVSDATEPHTVGYLDMKGAIAIHPRNAFNGSMDVVGQPNAHAWKVGSATLDASPIIAQPVPCTKGLVVAYNSEADPNDLLILNPTGGVVKRLRNPTPEWVGDLHPWQIIVHTSIDDSTHVIQHDQGATLIAADGTVIVERIPNGTIRPFHSDRAFLARFDKGMQVYRTYFIDRTGTARIEIRLPD